ncbi:hypothetical protein D3C80_1924180 [compost metagenome]
MNTSLRFALTSLLFGLCVAALSSCASPPPPVVVHAPPTKECSSTENTQVLGDARAEGEVTRVTTKTVCVTQ